METFIIILVALIIALGLGLVFARGILPLLFYKKRASTKDPIRYSPNREKKEESSCKTARPATMPLFYTVWTKLIGSKAPTLPLVMCAVPARATMGAPFSAGTIRRLVRITRKRSGPPKNPL